VERSIQSWIIYIFQKRSLLFFILVQGVYLLRMQVALYCCRSDHVTYSRVLLQSLYYV